jgi:hypothetical protein
MEVSKARQSGSADLSPGVRKGDTRVEVTLNNIEHDFDVIVRFPICQSEQVAPGQLVDDLDALISGTLDIAALENSDPESAWSVCLQRPKGAAGHFVVRKGEEVRVKLDLDFRGYGPQHVIIRAESFVFNGEGELGTPTADVLSLHKVSAVDLDRILAGRHSDAEVDLSLYYDVNTSESSDDPTFVRYESHDELYGSLEGLEEWEGLPAEDRFGGAVDAHEFLRHDRRMVPEDLEFDPEHADLAAIDTDSVSTDDGAVDCIQPGMSECWHPECGGGDTGAGAGLQARSTPRATTFTMSGIFSVRWTDNKERPGWGWKVSAWTDEFVGFLRGPEKLGEATVGSDGRWMVTTNNTEFTGADVYFLFHADNGYFRIADRHGNTRRVISSHRSSISSNYNAGSILCDGRKRLPGIGEMYYRGYELWSETFWRGGFNAASGSKATVYFPNDFYNCSLTYPWSCANRAGTEVWVTASHGIRRDTMQHELAHQIQATFWGRQPAGCCIPHGLGTCYNEGLGLSEGYANFMPYWVQSENRAVLPPALHGSRSIESPSSKTNCKTPGEDNEWWVASTFWDLYDSRPDLKDTLWFNHPGAVHKIALSNGPGLLNTGIGMPDMLPPYQAAASGGHQTVIENIFKQANTH